MHNQLPPLYINVPNSFVISIANRFEGAVKLLEQRHYKEFIPLAQSGLKQLCSEYVNRRENDKARDCETMLRGLAEDESVNTQIIGVYLTAMIKGWVEITSDYQLQRWNNLLQSMQDQLESIGQESKILDSIEMAIAALDKESLRGFAENIVAGLVALEQKFLKEGSSDEAAGCNQLVKENLLYLERQTSSAAAKNRFVAINLTAIIDMLTEISLPSLQGKRNELMQKAQDRLKTMFLAV